MIVLGRMKMSHERPQRIRFFWFFFYSLRERGKREKGKKREEREKKGGPSVSRYVCMGREKSKVTYQMQAAITYLTMLTLHQVS